MPGNGHIGGGSSCDVYFQVTDSGETRTLNDKDAKVGTCEVTVTFPQETEIKAVGRNSVTVKLKKGKTVVFEWTK
jgi:hypothetical protein